MIAFGRGGACETVIDAKGDSASGQPATGILFAQQTPQSLVEAIDRFAALERVFDSRAIRANAERFASASFRDGILQEVALALEDRSVRVRTGGER